MSNMPRIRDLGVTIGTLPPGQKNGITDVPGVQVGHLTLIEGEHGKSEPVIRTGATIIAPAPNFLEVPRYAAIWAFNGAGEMTGHHIIKEYGRLDGVIAITGTLNVGAVMEGLQRWYFREQDSGVKAAFPFHIPTVLRLSSAETLDIRLTDIRAFPMKPRDILGIKVTDGRILEGNVGGGTGMMSFGFKSGIGTSSRLLPVGSDGKQYTLGVLVQANHGNPRNFTVKGVPVGQKLWDEGWWDGVLGQKDKLAEEQQLKDGDGSLIVIIATDAPLIPYQLKRLAKRAAIGAGRQGAMGENFSGDIFLAFSTAVMQPPSKIDAPSETASLQGRDEKYPRHAPFVHETVQTVVDATINTLFSATADATEEAILNALAAAETMVGVGGYVAKEMPLQRVQEILREHGVIP